MNELCERCPINWDCAFVNHPKKGCEEWVEMIEEAEDRHADYIEDMTRAWRVMSQGEG